MTIERLQNAELDDLNDDNKGDCVGDDRCDIEEREEYADLKTDAIATSQKLYHEYDLPDQCEAGASGSDEERRKRGQYDMPQSLEPAKSEGGGHFQEVAVQRPGAFAHRHCDIRDLIDGNR